MKAYITRVHVEKNWQQALLAQFPVLEFVRFGSYGPAFIKLLTLPPNVKHLDLKNGKVKFMKGVVHKGIETLVLAETNTILDVNMFDAAALRSLTISRCFTSPNLGQVFRSLKNLRILTIREVARCHEEYLEMLPSSLTELRVPYLNCDEGDEPVREITPHLEVLDMPGIMIDSDITLFDSFENLRRLNIQESDIIDHVGLAPLTRLLQLEELLVSAKSDTDWSPLAHLSKLRLLSQTERFESKNKPSVRALERLPSLTRIECGENTTGLLTFIMPRITDIKILYGRGDRLVFAPEHFPKLTTLELPHSDVDLSSVGSSFPGLKKLVALYCPDLEDWSSLVALRHLEHLEVKYEQGYFDKKSYKTID